jgi:DNA-binding MarR family transcriptional regulator
MTNFLDHAEAHAVLRHYLADAGVDDTDGLELLRLVRMTGLAYDAILGQRMRDAQLSGPRWRLLLRLLLAEKQGIGAVNPTQLSLSQNVSKNTISAHLRALEDQGLIERELDPDDRRQFRIRLSETGRTLIEASTPDHMTFLNQLASDLSAEDRSTLTLLLNRLLRSLHAHGGCSSALD